MSRRARHGGARGRALRGCEGRTKAGERGAREKEGQRDRARELGSGVRERGSARERAQEERERATWWAGAATRGERCEGAR